jgi:hypothetical protein
MRNQRYFAPWFVLCRADREAAPRVGGGRSGVRTCPTFSKTKFPRRFSSCVSDTRPTCCTHILCSAAAVTKWPWPRPRSGTVTESTTWTRTFGRPVGASMMRHARPLTRTSLRGCRSMRRLCDPAASHPHLCWARQGTLRNYNLLVPPSPSAAAVSAERSVYMYIYIYMAWRRRIRCAGRRTRHASQPVV